MKILIGKQIPDADRATMERRPVLGIDLMEEASASLTGSFLEEAARQGLHPRSWTVLVGKGNNGGDGLAVARMLAEQGEKVSVLLFYPRERMTEETRTNLDRLPETVSTLICPEKTWLEFSAPSENVIFIDALLGSGVRGEVRPPVAGLIRRINSFGSRIWSIDLPSGLPTEPSSTGNGIPADPAVIQAEMTFTIAFPKLSLLFPETGRRAGRIRTVPLDLDRSYIESCPSDFIWVDGEYIDSLLRKMPRKEFMHKGNGGHVLLVCGCVGMTGAAVLAAGGALRSGCGLVTLHLPASERAVIHQVHPPVIVSCDSAPFFSEIPASPGKYTAVGTGCGLGQEEATAAALYRLLQWKKPMVLDADALNILSTHPQWLDAVPEGSVLTPHLLELARLAGPSAGPEERRRKALQLAKRTKSCVVVKGAHSMVVSPSGHCWFNSSGNPGMAKGGSGDVLTGLIAGLLAYGYPAEDAAVLGVWRHGRAGDAAAARYGEDAMNSQDLYHFL